MAFICQQLLFLLSASYESIILSIMARESDDDFQDDVVGESRVFDGFIIKPLIQGKYSTFR